MLCIGRYYKRYYTARRQNIVRAGMGLGARGIDAPREYTPSASVSINN